MASANILNTRTINFQELIGNGRVHRVPPFQRDYSWNQDQWEDLWNDILDAQRSGSIHYMGAIVVESRSDREFLIIDGQQRLATLSLLALAVIKNLHALENGGTSPVENRQRGKELRDRFIGERDPASLVESSRLFLNETDNGFYQDYLVPLREPQNPRGLVKSNRLLWDCFRYFDQRIGECLQWRQDGEALARLLSETVARRLLFILITVEDDINAYTVFETLNARGLELTTTDLLKNFLFSRITVDSDLHALQRRWRALISTVGQERFPEFLRFHLLCDIPGVRSQRLFKIVRDRVKSGPDVFALMTNLEARAEVYAAVLDPNHDFWVERAGAKPFIRELNLFGVRQMMPLLFAAWERFSAPDFERVLKLVSVLSFRFTVIGHLNTHPLEPAYHAAAKATLQGDATTPRAIFDLLREIYVDDGAFESSFAVASASNGRQYNRLSKYILCRIESEASHRIVDPDVDPASIEHVLPQNPSHEWAEEFPVELWERSVQRLGNLALLHRGTNRDLENLAYREKVSQYAQSPYLTTQQIAAIAPDHWTPELLDVRQQEMARRAVHIWRADFAQVTG